MLNKPIYKTIYFTDTTTKLYDTTELNTKNLQEVTQMDTTTYQEGTSVKMTTSSNLQTTTSVLGKFLYKVL